jgi:hypothetical protein
MPTYIPAIFVEDYVNYVFFEFFDDPETLPDIIQKVCGSVYNPSIHPDLKRYNPAYPKDLRERVQAMRKAGTEIALVSVAQEIAALKAARQSAAPAAGGMTPLQAQLKMQSLQTMSSVNNMLNQSMMQGGQSFNAGASNGVWVQKF